MEKIDEAKHKYFNCSSCNDTGYFEWLWSKKKMFTLPI